MRRFLNQLSKRTETFVRELVSLVDEFWSEHLIDALQPPVDEILVFQEEVERDQDLWTMVDNEQIPWTSEYQLFFARLQRNFIPQIPIPLGDERRTRSGDMFQLPSPLSLSPDSESSGPLSHSPSDRSARKRSPSKRPKSSGQVLSSPRKANPSPKKPDLLSKLHKQITMQGEQLTQLQQFVDRMSTTGGTPAHPESSETSTVGSSSTSAIPSTRATCANEPPPVSEDSEVVHTIPSAPEVSKALSQDQPGANKSSPVMNLNLTPLRKRATKKRSRSTRLSYVARTRV